MADIPATEVQQPQPIVLDRLAKKRLEYHQHKERYAARSKQYYVEVKDKKAAQYIIRCFQRGDKPKQSTIEKHLESIKSLCIEMNDAKTMFDVMASLR